MTFKFLPTSLEEGKEYYNNFKEFDVVFVTGDPYYDHPLSGMVIIARLLDKKGYKVGIISQPEKDKDYFKDVITVLGGVEATIRRFTHFDYKENKLRRGILNDTKADLLLFASAERSILEILERMKRIKIDKFEKIKSNLDLGSIEGIAFRVKKDEVSQKIRVLSSYEDCIEDKSKFNLLTRITYLLPDGNFIEKCGEGYIQHNRPCHTLTEKEIDFIYKSKFTRRLHPDSKNFGSDSKMLERLNNSVIIGRGCWGSCYFCIIPLVQGKDVAKRSKESIVKEIELLYSSGVKHINDLTLPTLNMYGSKCALYKHESKIYSQIINEEVIVYDKKEYCNQNCVGCDFRVLSDDLYPLLIEVEKLNKKYQTSLELRSAIRHDIILDQKKLFRKIMEFISRLKIAPENLDDAVLKHMNKSTASTFKEFLEEFKKPKNSVRKMKFM